KRSTSRQDRQLLGFQTFLFDQSLQKVLKLLLSFLDVFIADDLWEIAKSTGVAYKYLSPCSKGPRECGDFLRCAIVVNEWKIGCCDRQDILPDHRTYDRCCCVRSVLRFRCTWQSWRVCCIMAGQ
ncbi:MAG: hypothetical protein ACK55Z_36830, partial [bacterium]